MVDRIVTYMGASFPFFSGSEGALDAGTPAPVMATWILGFNHNNNKLSSFSVMILAHCSTEPSFKNNFQSIYLFHQKLKCI